MLTQEAQAAISKARPRLRPNGVAAEEAAREVLISYSGRVPSHELPAQPRALMDKVQETSGQQLIRASTRRPSNAGTG